MFDFIGRARSTNPCPGTARWLGPRVTAILGRASWQIATETAEQ
jgi:hypothetical protein